MHLETFVKGATEWQDHFTPHIGVRDLLRIASWKQINFQSHQAASATETITIKGAPQQTWREVRTAITGIAGPTWSANDRFLFAYSDIGRVGVTRWLKLSQAYSRGIKPLVQLLDLEGATIDAHVSQLGIAVEAIGYQALIDSGESPAAANGTRVEKRIEHLLTDVVGGISFNHATFAKDLADTYNSVKHANRATVAPALKLEHYRQGVALLRAWVALRLGVKKAVLAKRW